MGDAGVRSGGIHAQNLQAGTVSFSSTESSVSVSYPEAMRDAPAVALTNNADTDVYLSTRSNTGFTVDRASTGSSETVSWVAFNDRE